MEKGVFLKILQQELARATGCTEVGLAAYVVARAADILEEKPVLIDLTVSANIYKNGMNVGVPGTKLRGIPLAASLGLFLDSGKQLAILDGVTEETTKQALDFLQEATVRVSYTGQLDPIYGKAVVSGVHHTASATISGGHDRIIEITRDDEILFSDEGQAEAKTRLTGFSNFPLEDLIEQATNLEMSEVGFLMDAAEMNYRAAMTGINNEDMTLGPILSRRDCDSLPAPFSSMCRAQTLTGAAAEARMLGVQMPVMALTGSGNHGITNFLGLHALREDIEVDDLTFARALAISTAVTVYIKEHTSKLTAFCGCAIAPATGVAAGAVYLLGGGYDLMAGAMQSMIGTFGGMICDGAKESCAYKVSSATPMAIQFAYLAMEGAYIPEKDGIIGRDIEETIDNLSLLNDPGMVQTEEVVIRIIEKGQGG